MDNDFCRACEFARRVLRTPRRFRYNCSNEDSEYWQADLTDLTIAPGKCFELKEAKADE